MWLTSFFQRENEPDSASPPSTPARSAPSPPQQKRPASRELTHLARGSKIVGEISGAAELVIEGELEGEIDLDSRVVVGDRGQVQGKIVAAAVEVAGRVVGNVHGRERVEVLASGKLEGDVTSPRVVIAEGAFFKGKVEMTDRAATGRAATGRAATGNAAAGSSASKSRQSSSPASQPSASQPANPAPPAQAASPGRGGGRSNRGRRRR